MSLIMGFDAGATFTDAVLIDEWAIAPASLRAER